MKKESKRKGSLWAVFVPNFERELGRMGPP